MSATQNKVRLTGLARRLVNDGLLSEDTAVQANQGAAKAGQSLVSFLVENKKVDARTLAHLAAEEFGAPLLDLAVFDLSQAPVKDVEEKLLRRHHALPLFKRGKRLFLGLSDPTNLQAQDEIKFHTGCIVEPVVVEDDKLLTALDKAFESMDDALGDLGDDDLDLEVGEEDEQKDSSGAVSATSDADDAPVVRFVNKVLLDAIKQGASDIHFEPYEKFYRVRFRQDGMLREVAKPPINLSNKLAARLKVMSRLDISERRIPQDGRIKMKLSKNRAIDFRVSTCPTLFGEKIVMRILDPGSAMLGIDALGYEEHQKKLYLDALEKPYGMILVTGPTGSGKTVSLYTGVNILNTPDRNISTAEDPAEIQLPGVNQVNVQPKVGLTFAAALRAFLRQDPDVILVGEIRDLETAEIAIKASQTGHLVLSTLHTNDAPKTLSRLVDMGVQPYAIASSVTLIIAQRLGRRLCNNCKKPMEIPREALLKAGFSEEEVDGGLKPYGAVGCDQCNEGYKGRVGIYQVMPVTEGIGRIIMEGGNSMDIAAAANKDGIQDLRRSGLNRVADGTTSLEEILRVTTD
ncbi:type IV-A pilus assembly ATPase PilB [Natronospira bacteriovora]|uniref:Type IV-A pilus assembly ATPase PilB n=1 Tax=Natronospira bacteriovora TaxID=3069753 RepID=A0ABU0W7Q2_9GAMM|nr:type IV-A pilus assembly ATPase PilB [Natronospira sp. AB-CW4]MDQ2069490.1 type IV-A pilus assembly ATPase PilB [Natronospira sp. AB-CW4]